MVEQIVIFLARIKAIKILIFIPFLCLVLNQNLQSQTYSADLCNSGSTCASASSAYSGSYAASFAFDNYTTSANCWASNTAPTVGSPQWLKYDFGSGNEKEIVKYTITARYWSSDQTRCPKDWTFEASNDDSNWDVLDTRTDETAWNTSSSPTTKCEYTFTNSTAYRYYRIVITANNGGTSYVAIGEMEMMSYVVYTDYTSKRSNIWYFGNYAGLDFNTDPVSVLTDGSMFSREGCSSICDDDGNLLFYTDGIYVWNTDHDIMENGNNLIYVTDPMSLPHPTQAGVIVPNPGNSDQYYIFSVPCKWSSPSTDMYFRYAIVDMTYNSGLGKVTQKDMRIGAYTSSERITAVKHQNQQDIWVINHEDNTNKFRAYKVTSTGIDSNNVVISQLGAVSSGNCSVGCVKASPDGQKLAMTYWCDGASSKFELYDFDNSTGVISNLNDLGFPSGASRYTAYGIEFSPDGSKLYGSTHMDRKIHQWDLDAGDNTDILNSQTQVGTTTGNAGAMQLAPNGKIYCALSVDGNTGYHTIGVIDYPNETGTNCSYSNNGIRVDIDYTGVNLSRQGFPNFIQSYLSDEAILPVELSKFEANCTNNRVNIHWETLSEKNNDYFTIEKSTDLKYWEFLTNVNGSGTSNRKQSYTFEYEQENTLMYYRLIQTDYDGKTKVYLPVSSNCDCTNSNFNNIIISPNPAGDYFSISMLSATEDNLRISITNVAGQSIVRFQMELKKGTNEQEVETKNWAKGIYFINIYKSGTEQKEVIKLIKK